MSPIINITLNQKPNLGKAKINCNENLVHPVKLSQNNLNKYLSGVFACIYHYQGSVV